MLEPDREMQEEEEDNFYDVKTSIRLLASATQRSHD